MLAQSVANLANKLPAFGGGEHLPAGERLERAFNDLVIFLCRGLTDVAEHFIGGGVVDGKLPVGSFQPATGENPGVAFVELELFENLCFVHCRAATISISTLSPSRGRAVTATVVRAGGSESKKVA